MARAKKKDSKRPTHVRYTNEKRRIKNKQKKIAKHLKRCTKD